MPLVRRIDETLENALQRALNNGRQGRGETEAPPRLHQAMRHAVFPGGARMRPRLVYAVAESCGQIDVKTATAAAVSIELLHCASLVHDDLPCFDDAAIRRGRPSVHRAFGEAVAVLAGDGLIVLAFEVLAKGEIDCVRLPQLLSVMAQGVGAARGIIAGQAWESEPSPNLRAYHRAKTGALFEAATCAGAIAGGGDPEVWREVGGLLGEAYQIADDLLDALGGSEQAGKPVGQDMEHGRPNAARELGIRGAFRRFEELLTRLVDAVPDCPGRTRMRHELLAQCTRLLPDAQRGSSLLSGAGMLDTPVALGELLARPA